MDPANIYILVYHSSDENRHDFLYFILYLYLPTYLLCKSKFYSYIFTDKKIEYYVNLHHSIINTYIYCLRKNSNKCTVHSYTDEMYMMFHFNRIIKKINLQYTLKDWTEMTY